MTLAERKGDVHTRVKETIKIIEDLTAGANPIKDSDMLAYAEEVIYVMQILDELVDEIDDERILLMVLAVLSALWSGPAAIEGFLHVISTGLTVLNAQDIIEQFLRQRDDTTDTEQILSSTGGFKQ